MNATRATHVTLFVYRTCCDPAMATVVADSVLHNINIVDYSLVANMNADDNHVDGSVRSGSKEKADNPTTSLEGPLLPKRHDPVTSGNSTIKPTFGARG